ncbi:kinase-like domain, phloem protein 2-like protein [Tanacetum coccineum]
MMSSPNHDHLAHFKIPLENILEATNNFSDKNIIDRSGFDKRYWGKLLWSGELIDIIARRWLIKEWDDVKEQQFWMEISMLSSLKHKNLVSLVGFCDENGEKIIIIKHETRGSLSLYLSEPMLLTWVRRLEISIGVAHALSYIHYDEPRNFSVIHRFITSGTVLLNDDWEPKLSRFECSMRIEVSQRYHSFHNEILEYIDGHGDPTYIETKTVSHKSDMYSFGIVLFELLCGRESIIADNNNKYLAPLAITHYKEKALYDIIDPDLWKQMDPQSFNIFAQTAYDCLNEEQSQRPNIADILTRLEKALSFQLERKNGGSVSFISGVFESHVTKNIKRVETGAVTRKSDVYSFRAELFKAKTVMSAIHPDQKLGGGLSSQVKKSHLDHPSSRQVVKRFDIASRLQSIYEKISKDLEFPLNGVDGTSSDSNHLPQSSIMLKGRNFEHLKIGLNDILEATNNFDDAYCIGSGGFGKVYKADLEHFDSSNSLLIEGVDKSDLPRKRSTVAIKRIHNQAGEQDFIAEIESLTSCKHENIISLLGFCYEGTGAMILVYEHASKGSLEDYLGRSDKMTNLTWVQRVEICLDIAHGLNYIHNNTDHGKQKMIHRDIKSDNILLGDNWKAKIADFGLSKFHPAEQEADIIYIDTIAGTYVYLDPEYEKDGKLSRKSDIYSFGVVLLEVLTGRLAYESVYTKVNERGIAPIARDHFKKGTIMEIVDHKIKEETDEHAFSFSKGPDKESLNLFSELAFRCLAETQEQRPTMEVVIKELKKALLHQVIQFFKVYKFE